jgi:GNAT superfamily N-acetyltransferase
MVDISTAKPADLNIIASIMDELDHFYGSTDVPAPEIRMPTIQRLLFNATPAAHVLLARLNGDAIGLATYSFHWPAEGVTHSLFLKELYVRQAYKRQGIGSALFRAVCGVALEAGCSRVEWTTERTNADAMAFYVAQGANIDSSKAFYRLMSPDLRRATTL